MRRLILLVAFTVWLASLAAAWAAGFQPVSVDELKMTSEPLAPGAPAIILYRQVDRDDNGSTSHEDNYFRIKILTEEGRSYANVEIPFLKNTNNVVNIRARTIKPDGSFVEFDGKVFERTIAKARGVSYLAKTFALPDVEVGGIIEYSYTVDLKEHVIYGSHWILSQPLFTKRAQFSLTPYQNPGNSIPIGLHWITQGVAPDQVPKQGPDSVVRMQASNIAAFPIEDYMPPPDELKQRVDFIYQEGTPERDPDKYWQGVARKRDGTLEEFIGKRKSMEEAVAQTVAAADSPETKLRKIYHRVQQFRNTSYEIRKTEQEKKRENEKPPQNVEEVWRRGYGSQNQLNWLFLAMARAAGFEAYGCWVSSRAEYFFHPNAMDSNRLNASLVVVKLNGQDIYLDPGSAFVPFGVLWWPETGTGGLKLDKDGGSWIKTPLPASSLSQAQRKASLKLSDAGDLEGKLEIIYTGLQAIVRRREMINEDNTARKKLLEDQARRQVPLAAQLQLTNEPEWNGSESPLVTEFEIKIPGWASNAGKRKVMPAGIFTANEKRLFEHSGRVHPIYFDYAYEKTDDVTIALPVGWKVDGIPAAQNVDMRLTAYKRNVSQENGVLHLTRQLNIDILFLEQKEYATLRNFFQVVRTGDEEQIVLQPPSASN